MKAAFIESTGKPSVIQISEIASPTVQPSEVLVKTHTCSVNPIDTYIRSGSVAVSLEEPYIIGCDFAGVIENCGADVTGFQPGDRVWGCAQGVLGRQGSFAELIPVDQDYLYPIPDGVHDDLIAAGALVGMTAHLGLFLHAQLQPGEIVFVNGGTGGVGSSVVQFAKAAGAKVIATVGNETKKQLCEELGADLVINYHKDNMDEQIRDFCKTNGGINVWFETLREQNLDRTISMMAKRGRIIVMAGRNARPEIPVGPFYVNDLRMMGFTLFNASASEQKAAASQMNEWLAGGKWTPCIGARFPVTEAAAAHQLQEDNTLSGKQTLTGKIIIEMQ